MCPDPEGVTGSTCRRQAHGSTRSAASAAREGPAHGAPDPRPHPRRRPRAAPRPLRRTTSRGAWWRRARRPALHAVVSVSPLPVILALAAGHVVAVLALLSGLIVAAVTVLWTWRRRAGRRAVAEAAAIEHAERVLQEVYDGWVRDEAGRGERELDQWRRTHRL